VAIVLGLGYNTFMPLLLIFIFIIVLIEQELNKFMPGLKPALTSPERNQKIKALASRTSTPEQCQKWSYIHEEYKWVQRQLSSPKFSLTTYFQTNPLMAGYFHQKIEAERSMAAVLDS
jgi:hypothetical protein